MESLGLCLLQGQWLGDRRAKAESLRVFLSRQTFHTQQSKSLWEGKTVPSTSPAGLHAQQESSTEESGQAQEAPAGRISEVESKEDTRGGLSELFSASTRCTGSSSPISLKPAGLRVHKLAHPGEFRAVAQA